MNVRVYPTPNSQPVSGGAPNQTGTELPKVDTAHLVGDNVNKVDQLSSFVLLAFAVTGAVLVVLTHMVIG